MEKSSFFNSVNGDRKYKAEEFASYFGSFISNGIFPNPGNNLQVIANNDMTVTLKPGKGWINGYFYENTDDLIFNIDVADGVLDRIDRVVLKLDYVNREIKAAVKKGTFASSPVAPVLQRDMDIYELGLADIKVNKGVISILQSDITDTRLNLEFCGVTNSLITVDVGIISNQFSEDFDAWFETIKGALDGDVAGNLYNLIETKVNITDFNEHKEDNASHGIDDVKYNIYQLMLQDYYDKKSPYKKGLFFDGFINENVIDKTNSGIVLDTVNKHLKIYNEIKQPSAPANYIITLGDDSAITKVGQTIKIDAITSLKSIAIKMYKVGSPDDSVICKLYSMVNGLPATIIATATNLINGSSVNTNTDPNTTTDTVFLFDSIYLIPGDYAFAIERTGITSSPNHYRVYIDTSNPYKGGASVRYTSNNWIIAPTNYDFYFVIKLDSNQSSCYQTKEQAYTQYVNNAILYVKSKKEVGSFLTADIAIYTTSEIFEPMALESTRELEGGYQEDKFIYSGLQGNKVKLKLKLNNPTVDCEINQYGVILGVV